MAAGKRESLGRGLGALLGGESAAATAASAAAEGGKATRTLPIEFLHPGRYQPRRTIGEEQVRDLAASIREKGVLQPILVRRHPTIADAYEIIAGERRWRASQLAQLHEVPVIIKDLNDQETLEIALIENLQRENLSPLDESEGYARLMEEFAYTQEALAKSLGKSRSHVANMMRLLNLPEAVKELLDGGAISTGHARALLAASDPAALAREVVKKGLNVRQTEKLVGKAEKGGESAAAAKPAAQAKDTDTLALERDLGNMLGLKVDIRFTGKGGSLTIHYNNLEQLDDVLHRLSHGAHGHATGLQEGSDGE
ncbi:MAG: ParB/RepB/Spo0J family partition protein [Rhodospirillales bacterium]|nr:ParB/RepB/Spo0J family partition protein [Rhodospirillales bacterium]